MATMPATAVPATEPALISPRMLMRSLRGPQDGDAGIYSHSRATSARGPSSRPSAYAAVYQRSHISGMPISPRFAQKARVPDKRPASGRRAKRQVSPPVREVSPPAAEVRKTRAAPLPSTKEDDALQTWLRQKAQTAGVEEKRRQRVRERDINYTNKLKSRQMERQRIEARTRGLYVKCVELEKKATLLLNGSTAVPHDAVEGIIEQVEAVMEAYESLSSSPRAGEEGTGVEDASVASAAEAAREEKIAELAAELDELVLAAGIGAPRRTVSGSSSGSSEKDPTDICSLPDRFKMDQETMWEQSHKPKPEPGFGDGMDEFLAVFSNAKEKVAWRQALDPTQRHSRALRATTGNVPKPRTGGKQGPTEDQWLVASLRAKRGKGLR